MSEERILKIIPNVVYMGKRGLNDHVMYITTHKLYFIRTRKGYEKMRVPLLATYFEKEDKKNMDLKQFDYTDISSIINHKNFVRSISLKRITEIQLRREFARYRFIIHGYNKKSKIQKLIDGQLIPSQERINKEKKLGIKIKRTFEDYAWEVQNAIESVFLDKVTHKF